MAQEFEKENKNIIKCWEVEIPNTRNKHEYVNMCSSALNRQ